MNGLKMASSGCDDDDDDKKYTLIGSHTKTLTELATTSRKAGGSRMSSRKAERSMTSSRKVGKTLRKAVRSLRSPSWVFIASY